MSVIISELGLAKKCASFNFSAHLGSLFRYTYDPSKCAVQTRFKGHSKWSNIKHIKLANDTRISKLCSKYSYSIGVAIRENGMEKNPSYNAQLRKVINMALSEDVPKATIDNAIKRASSVDDTKEFIVELMGPGRSLIIVEMLAKNMFERDRVIGPLLRKIGGAHEKGALNNFHRRSVVIARPKESNHSMDMAETDAIEVGAEEVEELEKSEENEKPLFKFVADQFELSKIKSELESKKYVIETSGIYFIPNFFCHIETERELSVALRLIEALENGNGVHGVHHNIA